MIGVLKEETLLNKQGGVTSRRLLYILYIRHSKSIYVKIEEPLSTPPSPLTSKLCRGKFGRQLVEIELHFNFGQWSSTVTPLLGTLLRVLMYWHFFAATENGSNFKLSAV